MVVTVISEWPANSGTEMVPQRWRRLVVPATRSVPDDPSQMEFHHV
jgi:hypothetical protein